MAEEEKKGRSYGGKRVRQAAVGRRLPSRENPPCPDCTTKNVMRNGTRKGRQMFRCRDCGRSFFGEIPEVETYPCPYCGQNCRRHGYAPNSAQKYLCTVCGRLNTNLWPEEGRDAGGPFPYQASFCLDAPALEGLDLCRRRWGRNTGQAIRHLLIVFSEGEALPTVDWSEQATAGMAAESDRYGVSHRSPNLATVEGVHIATVSLNARALQGLAYTMWRYDLTRQEAVRWLLRRARIWENGRPDEDAYFAED